MKARPCQWCGKEFVGKSAARLYCSPQCKNNMGNFFTVVGKRICADAMFWRLKRGKAGGPAEAFKRVCWLLDEANREFKDKRPKGAPTIGEYVDAVDGSSQIRRGQDR